MDSYIERPYGKTVSHWDNKNTILSLSKRFLNLVFQYS